MFFRATNKLSHIYTQFRSTSYRYFFNYKSNANYSSNIFNKSRTLFLTSNLFYAFPVLCKDNDDKNEKIVPKAQIISA